MKIITNNQYRPLLNFYELSLEQQSSVDWVDLEDREYSHFFVYKGYPYHTSMFLRTETPGWDGILSDSYFTGVLARLSKDGESILVGRFQ